MEKKEFVFKGLVMNGFLALLLGLVLMGLGGWLFTQANGGHDAVALLGALCVLLGALTFGGIFKQEPNEAKAMVFFGKYRGTFAKDGFFFVNPFLSRKAVSLRARNLNPEHIKVNDKMGNPVLIGMVLVWKLEDTYKALFEIDSQVSATNANVKTYIMNVLENFVRVQSDAALRQVAGNYAYDNAASEDELTLRSNAGQINEELVDKLNERLAIAGIHIMEARINYLAYAPEIAAVMLRRQQADAIITAREKIVEGAVSMVKMALDKLKSEGVVDLDEEKKAAMVSNLLVVLCGDEPAQPVVNSGTLYN